MSKFVCPKCGAEPEKHGKGDCRDRDERCQGFLCDCDYTVDNYDHRQHGADAAYPCNAVCYHCGWTGIMPQQTFKVSELTGWAKEAWKAGWKPPTGWKPGKEPVVIKTTRKSAAK